MGAGKTQCTRTRTALPLLANDEGELLQSRGRQVHVEVDDHVRQLREVELDTVEHSALVRILTNGVCIVIATLSAISFMPSTFAVLQLISLTTKTSTITSTITAVARPTLGPLGPAAGML